MTETKKFTITVALASLACTAALLAAVGVAVAIATPSRPHASSTPVASTPAPVTAPAAPAPDPEAAFLALLSKDVDLTAAERAAVLGGARAEALDAGRKVCRAERAGAEAAAWRDVVRQAGADSLTARLFWPVVDAAVADGSLCPGAGAR